MTTPDVTWKSSQRLQQPPLKITRHAHVFPSEQMFPALPNRDVVKLVEGSEIARRFLVRQQRKRKGKRKSVATDGMERDELKVCCGAAAECPVNKDHHRRRRVPDHLRRPEDDDALVVRVEQHNGLCVVVKHNLTGRFGRMPVLAAADESRVRAQSSRRLCFEPHINCNLLCWCVL